MKIAHFSDVHALSLDGVRPWQWLSKRLPGYVNVRLNRREKHPLALFERLVEDLNALRPDHVIVTGDLTNLSLAGEFRLAREIVDRIHLGPHHVTVVPGNHDVYTVDALIGRGFQRTFRPYLQSDDAAREGFPVVRVRGEVVVVGLSTALPSPVPFASGRVGRAQLARVAEALRAHDGRFRVLALHHPPYRNRMFPLRALRDRGALQRILAEIGCELVLHGHEHRALHRTVKGPRGEIPVIGVASGTYADPHPARAARYNVYQVEDGRLVDVQSRFITT